MSKPREWLTKGLAVEEAFSGAQESWPEGGAHQGLQDRARHIHWMQHLNHRYGRVVAEALGAANELPALFDPVVALIRDKRKGNVPPAHTLETQFESLNEIWRDLRTNRTALQFQPRDELGNKLPPNAEEISRVLGLTPTYNTPETGREVAHAITPAMYEAGRRDPEVETSEQMLRRLLRR